MPTPITSTSGMRVDAEWPAPEAWQLWQRPGCQPGLGPDAARPAGVRTVTVPGAEDMWDLTVANDHDFCVVTVNTAVLVHDCPLTGGPDWDPVKPPRIQNPELQSIADQLYRPGASIGNGGTATPSALDSATSSRVPNGLRTWAAGSLTIRELRPQVSTRPNRCCRS